MTLPTVAGYEVLLRQSGLIDPERLDALLGQIRSQHGPRADAPEFLAEQLIEAGVLTPWQHRIFLEGRQDSLMAGNHRGFFLGSYKLLSQLGDGQSERVFLAEHTVTGEFRAIKVFVNPPGGAASLLERFRQESRSLAVLKHPNIVRAYDFSCEGEVFYLVMEYVRGPNLKTVVQEHGPLEFSKATDYIRQAAEALAHAHRAGVAHGGLQPTNLLLSPSECVKVSDFGIARLESEGADATVVTVLKATFASNVDYLSPEQTDGQAPTSASDLYSLGCTLYFLLTGHPPFPRGTRAQRMLAHQTQRPPSILEQRPGAPPELVAICEQMLAKDPADRFASADEISHRLTFSDDSLDEDEPTDPNEESFAPWASSFGFHPSVQEPTSPQSAAAASHPTARPPGSPYPGNPPPAPAGLDTAGSDTSGPPHPSDGLDAPATGFGGIRPEFSDPESPARGGSSAAMPAQGHPQGRWQDDHNQSLQASQAADQKIVCRTCGLEFSQIMYRSQCPQCGTIHGSTAGNSPYTGYSGSPDRTVPQPSLPPDYILDPEWGSGARSSNPSADLSGPPAASPSPSPAKASLQRSPIRPSTGAPPHLSPGLTPPGLANPGFQDPRLTSHDSQPPSSLSGLQPPSSLSISQTPGSLPSAERGGGGAEGGSADQPIKASCPACGERFLARWTKCIICGSPTIMHNLSEGSVGMDPGAPLGGFEPGHLGASWGPSSADEDDPEADYSQAPASSQSVGHSKLPAEVSAALDAVWQEREVVPDQAQSPPPTQPSQSGSGSQIDPQTEVAGSAQTWEAQTAQSPSSASSQPRAFQSSSSDTTPAELRASHSASAEQETAGYQAANHDTAGHDTPGHQTANRKNSRRQSSGAAQSEPGKPAGKRSALEEMPLSVAGGPPGVPQFSVDFDPTATGDDDFEDFLSEATTDSKRKNEVTAAHYALLAVGVIACSMLGVLVLADWYSETKQTQSSRVPPALESDENLRVLGAEPARGVLDVVFNKHPSVPENSPHQPALLYEVLVRPTEGQALRPLRDGEELSGPDAHYVVLLHPQTEGYLYVFHVDSLRRLVVLYPQVPGQSASFGSNPTLAEPIQLPTASRGRYFLVANRGGLEHIYAVFSLTRWEKLEEALAERSTNPPIVPEPDVTRVDKSLPLSRGVGGSTPLVGPVSVLQGHQSLKVDLPNPKAILPADPNFGFLVIGKQFRTPQPQTPSRRTGP